MPSSRTVLPASCLHHGLHASSHIGRGHPPVRAFETQLQTAESRDERDWGQI